MAGQPWHYRFYVDAELQGTDSESVRYVNSVMDALKKQADQVRLLGIYAEASRIN